MSKFSAPPRKAGKSTTAKGRHGKDKAGTDRRMAQRPGKHDESGWSPLGPGRIDAEVETYVPQEPRQKRTHGGGEAHSRPKPNAPRHQPKPQKSQPPREVRPDTKKYGQLLYGLHAVREAWLNPARPCRQLWLSGNASEEFSAVLRQAREQGLQRPDFQRADKTLLDQMLPGAVHQGIVLDTAPLPDTSLEQLLKRQPRLLIVLDQVTDPHNVGAIMRSAAAFGAAGIVLTDRHAPGMTGTLAKAASGALEHVALVHVVNLARALDQLRDAGFWCVGLAEEGPRELRQLDLSGPTALVLGAEGEGLRRLTRERCDELAHLPTQGAIGSLNVSNAAAVALYEAQRQK